MGAPGCPEFACCTASIAKVRMVLMHSISNCLPVAKVCSLTAMEAPTFSRVCQFTHPDESASLLNSVLRNGKFPYRPLPVYQFLPSRVAGNVLSPRLRGTCSILRFAIAILGESEGLTRRQRFHFHGSNLSEAT